MDTLNYQQLFYFWMVAREGGLTHAGRVLRLSHPTLHAHVKGLEERLEQKLFTRVGRRLVLTDAGRLVQQYADQIFALGQELVDVVRDHGSGQAPPLNVGVVSAVPKLIVRELLEPVTRLDAPIRVVCTQGPFDWLLAELSLHRLDVVIADTRIPEGSHVRAFHHPLGQSGVGIFGVPSMATKYRRGFPESLHEAPMLLPVQGQPLRRAIDGWLADLGIQPRIVAELADSALLKDFGSVGAGLFPASLAIAAEMGDEYGTRLVGRAGRFVEHFHAITLERRLNSPALRSLFDAANVDLFPGGKQRRGHANRQ